MRIARPLLTLALVIAAIAFFAAPAWAHAAYDSSEPPDDGQVSSPPGEVTATFTEPLADGSFLQITDPCGERVDHGDVQIVGYDMSVSMSGAAAGRYTVFYRAFSTLDPHVTEGTFGFTSTGGDACAGDEPEDPAEPKDGTSGPTDESSGPTESSSRGATTVGDRSGSSGGPTGPGSRVRSRTKTDGELTGNNRTRGAGSAEDQEEPQLATEPEEAETPSVWDGIPLEPFLTGLLLAAIIGAAGGKMYAGIVGPRA